MTQLLNHIETHNQLIEILSKSPKLTISYYIKYIWCWKITLYIVTPAIYLMVRPEWSQPKFLLRIQSFRWRQLSLNNWFDEAVHSLQLSSIRVDPSLCLGSEFLHLFKTQWNKNEKLFKLKERVVAYCSYWNANFSLSLVFVRKRKWHILERRKGKKNILG